MISRAMEFVPACKFKVYKFVMYVDQTQVTGRMLKLLKKVVYTGHMKFLPYGNTLRHHSNRRKFDSTNCDSVKPSYVTSELWLEKKYQPIDTECFKLKGMC
jgi:hypothetical protein